MPFKASYPGQSFSKEILGFKIIACVNPQTGFSNNFCVYIHEVLTKDDKEFSSINFPADKPGLRGTLQIENDSFIAYSFKDIDLVEFEIADTFRAKHRLLKFQYNPDLLQGGKGKELISAKSSLSSNSITKPKKPYLYSISDGEEPLLFFNSALNPTAAVLAFQFSSFRTQTNSFIDQAIDLDAKITKGNSWSASYKINGQTIDAQPANFNFLFVDESAGSLLGFPLPTIDSVKSRNQSDLVRISFDSFTKPITYYNHYTSDKPEKVNPFYSLGDLNALPYSIETGIIVLNNGEGKQIAPVLI